MNLSAPENLAIVDHLLTTTRSVRKRLDFSRPVEREVILRCLEIAMQAPTASNSQGWHFVVVGDPEKRAAIAALYRKAYSDYIGRSGIAVIKSSLNRKKTPHASLAQMTRVARSSTYLAQHLHEVPIIIIPCIKGRVESEPLSTQAARYGSILPATWSLMLALRARGLGTAWTTMHLNYEKEVAQILSIPDTMMQVALLPVAYFKGEDFKPAKRLPASNFIHWEAW